VDVTDDGEHGARLKASCVDSTFRELCGVQRLLAATRIDDPAKPDCPPITRDAGRRESGYAKGVAEAKQLRQK
jgi:hypothetical protein